jgi:altronate hydrolase
MGHCNFEQVAIVINPEKDNVAVCTAEFIEKETVISLPSHLNGNRPKTLTTTGRIVRGQSFALSNVEKGKPYTSLGDPVGLAKREVLPGEPISDENLIHRLPHLRARYRDNPEPTPLSPQLSARTFDGYVRSDGTVGVRNLVGIVTSGMCSSTEAREIAARAMREVYSREKFPNVDGIVPIVQESGCGMPDGRALNLLNLLLADSLRHPNLGAVLYTDLGCGKTCVECSVPIFQQGVPNYNQRVVNLVVQTAGGSKKTVVRGLEMIERLLHYANRFERQPVPVSKLIVGTQCGGSDRWSGVTANPAVGVAADMTVQGGGAVLLPEIPELQGGGMLTLVQRARSRQVGKKLMNALKRYERYVHMFGDDFRENPSPGNKKGGLYNIFLKSSGVKSKGGTSIVEDLVEYGEWLGDRKGLYVLYTPGYDQVSTPALFLSGAQVAIFTTGRGTGIGCALGPVIKVASNSQLAHFNGDIDVNAGTILEGKDSTQGVGEKIFTEILDVASGRKLTKSEESGFHTEFKIWESLWPTL